MVGVEPELSDAVRALGIVGSAVGRHRPTHVHTSGPTRLLRGRHAQPEAVVGVEACWPRKLSRVVGTQRETLRKADPVPPPQLVGLVEALAVEVEVGVPPQWAPALIGTRTPAPRCPSARGRCPRPRVEIETALEVLVEVDDIASGRRQRQAEGHHTQKEHRHDTYQARAFPWGIVSSVAVSACGRPLAKEESAVWSVPQRG